MLFEDSSERVGSRHVQVFIPSVDREGEPIPQGQEFWVDQCLEVLGTQFGGATALPPAKGVWRDDERGGELVFDRTVIVFSYVSEDDLTEEKAEEVLRFLRRLGREGDQGEVGIFVEGTYFGLQDFDETPEKRDQDG